MLLNQFARGEDVYCDFAGRIFGRPITRKDELERKVGKEAVLGCGYGMGAERFGSDCAAKGIDLVRAGTTAAAVVEGYRDAYPAIAGVRQSWSEKNFRRGGLWKSVEQAALQAVVTGRTHYAGRCTFERDGATMVVVLPSGRRLHYRNARIEQQVPGYARTLGLSAAAKPTLVFDEGKKLAVSTYGGKLVENIVQAICRDLLAAALLECERQGLAVVLHVHDEIVVETDAGRAESDLQRLVSVMSTPPAWATGFPLQVEGFAAQRYSKSGPAGAPQAKARDGRLL